MAGTQVKAPAPVIDQTIASVNAAVCPEDAPYRNEKRVTRKLRIRVLDCRSGKPVINWPVQEVLIAAEGAAWDPKTQAAARFVGDCQWDIEKDFWVNSIGNAPQMNKALKALGYTPDPKGLAAYQAKFYGDKKPERPEKQKAVWYKRIGEEYNQKFIEAVQYYLQALSFLNQDCATGKWEDGGPTQEAFVRWQKVELGYANPFKHIRFAAALAAKLKNARKNFFTDEHGVLHITVPVAKVQAGFQLRVTFKEFPLVLEEENFRKKDATGATDYSIEWVNTQDAKTGAWGWRVRPDRPPYNKKPPADLPEFRSFLDLHIPATKDLEKMWRALKSEALKTARFSPFYLNADESASGVAEYVAFALQWCQPVWDEYENPAARNDAAAASYFNNDVYVQKASERGTRMHLVTTYFDLGGSDKYGGKGYGKYEWSVDPRWRGVHGFGGWMDCDDCLPFLRGERGDPKLWDLREKYGAHLLQGDLSLVQDPFLGIQLPGKFDRLRLTTDRPEHDWAWDSGKSELCHALDKTGKLCKKPASVHITALSESDKALYRSGKLGRAMEAVGGHAGIDVHARKDDNVFAVHSGPIVWHIGGVAGKYILHNIKAQGESFQIGYLHLSDRTAPDGSIVKTGQVIGKAGRTGNLGEKSEWPGHVHLNLAGPDALRNWLAQNDPTNRFCVPTNDAPLIFPCRCHVTEAAGPKPWNHGDSKDCKFADARFVQICWAVAELKCPYMAAAARDDPFRVQAQLRFLWETKGDPFVDPGPVDGDMGPLPGPKVRVGKTRAAIRALMLAQGPQPAESYEADEPFLNSLNSLAPIGKPE